MFRLILILLSVSIFFSCGEEYIPKPKGYPRMDFPVRQYVELASDCPFTFRHHASAQITPALQEDKPCWLNIDYPFLRCRLHLSYLRVDGNLEQMLEDVRTLVYKHSIKASSIERMEMSRPEDRVYGGIFEIGGNAASSVQFYATDSLQHFIRGALYFNAASNADSLQPAINYVREDVKELMATLRWATN